MPALRFSRESKALALREGMDLEIGKGWKNIILEIDKPAVFTNFGSIRDRSWRENIGHCKGLQGQKEGFKLSKIS